MLIERLFTSGVMQMGPSHVDPNRQVGVFNPKIVAGLPAMRAGKIDEFSWIAGEWNHENIVPVTSASPGYTDVGSGRFSLCEKKNWICIVDRDGREIPNITFDPFSGHWIYLLINGAYGLLRSTEGWTGNQIVFSGSMTMLGIDCDWRMRWTKHNNDAFSFLNEERDVNGEWSYIDEWRFTRRA